MINERQRRVRHCHFDAGLRRWDCHTRKDALVLGFRSLRACRSRCGGRET
jgi:hypothetical protein